MSVACSGANNYSLHASSNVSKVLVKQNVRSAIVHIYIYIYMLASKINLTGQFHSVYVIVCRLETKRQAPIKITNEKLVTCMSIIMSVCDGRHGTIPSLRLIVSPSETAVGVASNFLFLFSIQSSLVGLLAPQSVIDSFRTR